MATASPTRTTHNTDSLTEKEKQTLRLLLAGHDAKSMARHLGLSVHTVNERLRYARRKLSASSSREAARLLRQAEETFPETLGDELLGDAPPGAIAEQGRQPAAAWLASPRKLWPIGGIAMISSLIALLALSASPQAPDAGAAPAPAHAEAATGPASAAETGATAAARQWLALVDAGKWQESWAGTARSFQSLNTVAAWQSASESGRVPLGRVLSRSAAGEETIPAPPHGYQLVRFRTAFANKAAATETLSLAREGGGWKVAGYMID
jgi:DNA-binding CsgD family transcriptional regulator